MCKTCVKRVKNKNMCIKNVERKRLKHYLKNLRNLKDEEMMVEGGEPAQHEAENEEALFLKEYMSAMKNL